MATNFGRWEKDPFFSAAEEVQNSADRMESAYRKWMRDRKDGSAEELQKELQTALGTTKWQLEEFQRAASSCLGEDARDRHHHFVAAIDDQILRTENSLRNLVLKDGETELPWVRLDAEERDELALFLSSSSPDSSTRKDEEEGSSGQSFSEAFVDCSKNSSDSVDLDVRDSRQESAYGHRRTVSADADMSTWNIAISDDGRSHLPPPRVPSLSNFIKTVDMKSKLQLPKNGFRKWKAPDHLAPETESLQSHQFSEGIAACYERGRSNCLDSCRNESYRKHIYGWLGIVQRQIRRSQYQIQYNRSIQMTFWIALIVFLIVTIIWSCLVGDGEACCSPFATGRCLPLRLFLLAMATVHHRERRRALLLLCRMLTISGLG